MLAIDPFWTTLVQNAPMTIGAIGALILGIMNRKDLKAASVKISATKSVVEDTRQETQSLKEHLNGKMAELIRATGDAALKKGLDAKGTIDQLVQTTAEAEYAKGKLEGGRDQRDVRDAKALELDRQTDATKITGQKRE